MLELIKKVGFVLRWLMSVMTLGLIWFLVKKHKEDKAVLKSEAQGDSDETFLMERIEDIEKKWLSDAELAKAEIDKKVTHK